MAFKPSAAETILKQCTGRQSGGILGTCYMALFTSPPSSDGTGFTEMSGNGYLRVLIGNSSQSETQKMGTLAGGHIENDEIIYFPETTGSWSGLTHWGFFTGATGGTPEMWSPLTGGPITIPSGYIPLFRVGTFEMDLA